MLAEPKSTTETAPAAPHPATRPLPVPIVPGLELPPDSARYRLKNKLLGRPLQPADEMQGAPPVVVLGYDVWQRQFLHDPAIIGRVVTVGRTARTVVGVMPPRFGFPRNQQLWVPLLIQDAVPREGPAVQVFGRLAEGASWRDAAAELDVVSARLAADQPATHAQLRTRVRAFAGRTPIKRPALRHDPAPGVARGDEENFDCARRPPPGQRRAARWQPQNAPA